MRITDSPNSLSPLSSLSLSLSLLEKGNGSLKVCNSQDNISAVAISTKEAKKVPVHSSNDIEAVSSANEMDEFKTRGRSGTIDMYEQMSFGAKKAVADDLFVDEKLNRDSNRNVEIQQTALSIIRNWNNRKRKKYNTQSAYQQFLKEEMKVPVDLMCYIFTFLSVRDVLCAGLVCKAWNNILGFFGNHSKNTSLLQIVHCD